MCEASWCCQFVSLHQHIGCVMHCWVLTAAALAAAPLRACLLCNSVFAACLVTSSSCLVTTSLPAAASFIMCACSAAAAVALAVLQQRSVAVQFFACVMYGMLVFCCEYRVFCDVF